MLPWQNWAALGWQGVALAVLLLPRLPLLLARPLRFALPDAGCLGWFGPIGVSAVFYLTLIAERLTATPGLLAAGTLAVVTSVVVRGTTAAPGVVLYRRVVGLGRVQRRADAELGLRCTEPRGEQPLSAVRMGSEHPCEI